MYHNALGTANGYCDSAGGTTGAGSGQWFFYKNSSNQVLYGQHGAAALITTTTTIGATTWTHVAVCRSGTTTRVFINGVESGSTTTSPNFNSAGGIQIGMISTPYYMNGYIDDLRISKYARYTTNFTPPTSQLQDQ